MGNESVIRSELLSLTQGHVQALAPFLWVFFGSMVALLVSTIRFMKPKWPVLITAIVACFMGLYLSADLLHNDSVKLFNQSMVVDSFSNFFNILFLLAAIFTCLVSSQYLDKEKLQYPEYYLLILFSALGMMLMVSALDLIVLFIALELMSLSVYVLVGFRRVDRRSNEAALKYFILGSAASAVLLYGAALLYGATASMNIAKILEYTQTHPAPLSPVFVLGVWFVIFGFLFKVAAVPFHMWMPDVYEGAPVPITGFMTTGLKAAAFATFLRVFLSLNGGENSNIHFHHILWVVAVLTMVGGNVVALTQTNLKRMLGYSSIAHTGYLLVGLISGRLSEQGSTPVVLYIVAYAIMNLGAFIVLTIMSGKDDSRLNLHDLSGLARKHPWLAFCMAVFLLSMAGIPPTAGFVAKYLLFYSAIQAGETVLVVIGVLCSAISVYYYLRVLVYMYMRDPAEAGDELRISIASTLTVTAMVLLTLQIGVLPKQMMIAARKAMTHLE